MCTWSSPIIQMNYLVSCDFNINCFNLIIADNTEMFRIQQQLWFKFEIAYFLFRFFDFFSFIVDFIKVKSLSRLFIKLPEPIDCLIRHAHGGAAFWFKAMLQPIIFFSKSKKSLWLFQQTDLSVNDFNGFLYTVERKFSKIRAWVFLFKIIYHKIWPSLCWSETKQKQEEIVSIGQSRKTIKWFNKKEREREGGKSREGVKVEREKK